MAIEVGAFQGDALLATKLHVPRPQPGFVARPRLVDRLEEGLARGLVLVGAPAGSGKTTLLADWAAATEGPVAWLSLDAGDNDPARFWRHAVAALGRVRAGLADRVIPLLGPPAPPAFEGLVTALVNELAAQPGPLALVVDDYQLIDAGPVHASFGFLLEHRPPGLRLVLASRADPPLPLARLRARGQLAELGVADLRFTSGEAAALLAAALGTELPAAAVAALADRTEGWAAGLQLAALSLRGHRDPGGFVAGFSGSHRYVLDYLTEEVLDRQPEHVRDFLLETSILERLSGPLCDAVTGRADGQAMLERVERANLFLHPLDDVRGWWRYHHLFADLLRARLRQEQPARVAALHARAATWCERHGLADHAVRHALGTRDGAWAARLVEQEVDGLLLRSEGATLQRWLAMLPTEPVRSRPRLLLAQARLALLGGRLDEVEAPLDAAERALGRDPGLAEEPYRPSVGRAAGLLANVPATIALDRAYLAELRGDAGQAVAFAEQARAQIGEDEWMLASHADGYLALARWLDGRLAEAERGLSATVARWRGAGQRYLAVRGCHHLGQVQRAQGRLDAAVATYRQALGVAAPPGEPALPAAGIAHVGLAEVAYQQGRLEDALGHLADGLGPCRQLAYTQPLATGLATLALVRQAGGDPAGALEAMAEAEQVAPGAGVTNLLNPVPAQRARLLLAQGDLAGADRWARERGLGADDPATASYAREPEQLVLVRVWLAQDRPEPALALLDRLLAAAAGQGRLGSLVELRALQGLALAAAGDEPAALAALADALTLACPQGYVRIFADEGRPMAALCGRLVRARRAGATAAGGVPLACLARLLRAFDAGPGTPARPALAEPLTPRELEVLGLLAAGRSNQGIAQDLVVSLDTVKKHVSHVLDKLGASNRTEAVTRARELGLLP